MKYHEVNVYVPPVLDEEWDEQDEDIQLRLAPDPYDGERTRALLPYAYEQH